MKLGACAWVSVVLALTAVPAAAAPQVTYDTGAPGAPPSSFLDRTLAIIRHYVAGTTTMVANVNIIRRAPGLTHAVKSDVRVMVRAPDYLLKEVKNPYAYTVLVSNGTVQVWFPPGNDYDARPLEPGETIWEDFLGVCVFAAEREWDFDFRTEGELYVLAARLRPAPLAALRADELRHARRAVRRTIWVDPRQNIVVKTQRQALLGEDTICEFRDQWRTMGLLLP